jgi:hypothetical protein
MRTEYWSGSSSITTRIPAHGGCDLVGIAVGQRGVLAVIVPGVRIDDQDAVLAVLHPEIV